VALPDPLHAVDAAAVSRDHALRDPTVRVDDRGLAWFLDGAHVREALGATVPAADLGEEPVDVRVEVAVALARPVRRALARHANGEVAAAEHEERELSRLTATVPERRLASLADDLREASSGTAWAWRA
jgi:hypothetical protein